MTKQIVINEIADNLQTYLSKVLNVQFAISTTDKDIEIIGDPNSSNSFLMYFLQIPENGDYIEITRIFLPPSERKTRKGLGMIRISYAVARQHNYATVISQTTQSFYDYLINKGAHSLKPNEAVQLLDTTQI
ncbi:hypothetical protein J2S74_001988 [Evansella vedderi]|uniref:N-acetyltransferase domain-containing protein n=1 Tax=Evansella vedderi TaxID=38282 RepID=A0ABT9ZTN8_9BACI|nr:hypothetical protein [Evansella vedderi]MDQ0254609.1 hypothetical protein [Evansella vedderi]